MNAASSTLLRRSDVFRLAEPFRQQFIHQRIDDVARKFDIRLQRAPHPGNGPDGVAVIDTYTQPIAIEPLACDRPIRVWGGYAKAEDRYVLINSNSTLPEREIWWHELYHVLFSPRTDRRTVFTFNSSYEYRREERRADDFAAAILVPTLVRVNSLDDIEAQFDVSKRLARHAMDLHVALAIER